MLSQHMKTHTLTVALKAEHSDLEIPRFLSVVQSFFVKIRKKLEAVDGDSTAVCRRKTPIKGTNIFRTPTLYKRCGRLLIKPPKVKLQPLIRSPMFQGSIVHEGLRYNLYARRRGQFISAKTKLLRERPTLNMLTRNTATMC